MTYFVSLFIYFYNSILVWIWNKSFYLVWVVFTKVFGGVTTKRTGGWVDGSSEWREGWYVDSCENNAFGFNQADWKLLWSSPWFNVFFLVVGLKRTNNTLITIILISTIIIIHHYHFTLIIPHLLSYFQKKKWINYFDNNRAKLKK